MNQEPFEDKKRQIVKEGHGVGVTKHCWVLGGRTFLLGIQCVVYFWGPAKKNLTCICTLTLTPRHSMRPYIPKDGKNTFQLPSFAEKTDQPY